MPGLTNSPRCSQFDVNSGGARINASVSGTGPPVMLLHGFLGSGSQWDPVARRLEGEYSCISLDLIGHGHSSVPTSPARYSMPNQVRDIRTVLDSLQLSSCGLIGYSMGGRVALSAALEMPERIDSLILVGTAAGIGPLTERRERALADAKLAKMIETVGMEAFVDYWEAQPLFASQVQLSDRRRRQIRRQRLATAPDAARGTLQALSPGRCRSQWDSLGQLHMPVLVVAGANDVKYVAETERMAARIPVCERVIVPRAGHAVHQEQPARLQRVISEFLDRTYK